MSHTTSTESRPTQQAVIGVIHVGYGAQGTNDDITNEIRAHLPIMEKRFGIPFYLIGFKWQTDKDPYLRYEHRGDYDSPFLPNPDYDDIARDVLEYIDKEVNYIYDRQLGFLKARDKRPWTYTPPSK
jgi:hypothetical protein